MLCVAMGFLLGMSYLRVSACLLSLQIRKMDLEARTLPPAQKATLLAKLREYKSDLNTLKREVKKSATDSLSTRDDLLESGLLDQQYTGVKYSSSLISRCISIPCLFVCRGASQEYESQAIVPC